MDSCPTCLREFKRLEDYPYVYIVRFDKLQLPELIGGDLFMSIPEKDVPKEALQMLRRRGRIAYQDFVYQLERSSGLYSKSPDITPEVREAMEDQEIKRYLGSLESYVGKEVRTRNILPNWERNHAWVFFHPSRPYRIYLHDTDKTNGHSNARLTLGIRESPLILGTIGYEGRVSVPQAVS